MTNKPALKEKGQLSIFLGISLLVVITLLAFVINVGLFVKAKINLQNAVDAAAWSGAATQARQLTNISYLNWEMRNTYKEWMFKYYVLGQMGLTSTSASALANSSQNFVNFRTRPFFSPGSVGTDGASTFDPTVVDYFNVPSICIHFGTEHDVCQIYDIPGVPRFTTVGLPGIAEQHETFLSSIAKTKAKDCSARSDINLSNAVIWAYGTKVSPNTQVPLVAPHRTGAWIQAIELSLRMRNLEMIVNRPPVEGICFDNAEAAGPCERTVAQLDTESNIMPINERPIKAYWSAFRNLAGGDSKEENPELTSDLAKTFTLTELAPQPLEVDPNTLSGFLIPAEATIGQSGIKALVKHYLDLQIYPLNLVTFYTTFVSKVGVFRDSENYTFCRNNPSDPACTTSEAECGATKTGLPIPAYPFGFVKNPKVTTYYAVKGQAKFVGMFYPFADPDGIDMFAYASAKPFGGRVGPRLFDFDPSNTNVRGRDSNLQRRSTPYLSGFDVTTLPGRGSKFEAGFPIPSNEDFWVKESRPVGGVPGSNSTVSFAIPNLLYDYTNFSEIDPFQANASKPVLELKAALNFSEGYERAPDNERIKGLYSKDQFLPFQANLGEVTGTILSANAIDNAIEKVRAPTRYEALNYMIPTFEEEPRNINSETPDAAPAVHSVDRLIEGRDGTTHIYNLFAPLFGSDTLYKELSTVTNILTNYIDANRPALEAFLKALAIVAKSMRDQSADETVTVNADTFIEAANTIHPSRSPNNPFEGLSISGVEACPTLSMAAKFNQLFLGNSTECGIVPLKDSVREYINTENGDSFQNGDNFPYNMYYQSTYRLKPNGPTNRQLLSAYSPGPRQGAGLDGSLPHPFGFGSTLSGKRNFYSTKFVALEKLEGNTAATFTKPGAYQEQANATASDMFAEEEMLNPLQPNQLEPFGAPTH